MRPYAYASEPDIRRLLQFLPATITATSRPQATQLHNALVAASDELDSALALVNYDTPVSTVASIAQGALRSWAAIGAAGEVAFALPQGSDSKHAKGYQEKFSAILEGIRDRDRELPDASKGSRSRPRHPRTPAGAIGGSPMFSRDSIGDR